LRNDDDDDDDDDDDEEEDRNTKWMSIMKQVRQSLT
jgi:hypothetical protein